MDLNALFKIGYGLYIIASRVDGKDNGCIINTVMQVTENPLRIMVAINKMNLTHDMVLESGRFTLSVLSQDAPFSLIQHFGYQSGRDVNKFENPPVACEPWGKCLRVLEHVNASLCCKVVDVMDLGTHTVFLADVLEAQTLSPSETLTYSYYQNNVKPKPTRSARVAEQAKPIWHCRVCGFEVEMDELPDDYICPVCKHGKDAFDKIEVKPKKAKKQITIWHCRVCGFEVEMDELPDDYICPICKYGKDAFDKIVIDVEEEPKATKQTIIWHCRVCGFEVEMDELPDDYICPVCKHGKDAFDKIVIEVEEEPSKNVAKKNQQTPNNKGEKVRKPSMVIRVELANGKVERRG